MSGGRPARGRALPAGRLLAAGALLALLGPVAACGDSARPPPPVHHVADCLDPRAPHQATVVVQHQSGSIVQRCVGFAADRLDGDRLMQLSGIQYQAQTFPGHGRVVCQLDNEPAQFDECLPAAGAFWITMLSVREGPWRQAVTGYASIQLRDGDALGWQYRAEVASPIPMPPR